MSFSAQPCDSAIKDSSPPPNERLHVSWDFRCPSRPASLWQPVLNYWPFSCKHLKPLISSDDPGRPHLVVLHRRCTFYKLKARPSIGKKIAAHFITVLALLLFWLYCCSHLTAVLALRRQSLYGSGLEPTLRVSLGGVPGGISITPSEQRIALSGARPFQTAILFLSFGSRCLVSPGRWGRPKTILPRSKL